ALVSNTQQDPRWLLRPWEEQPLAARSAISVPLIAAGGVVGVMTLTHTDAGYFADADLALLTAISSCISLSHARLSSLVTTRADNQAEPSQPLPLPLPMPGNHRVPETDPARPGASASHPA